MDRLAELLALLATLADLSAEDLVTLESDLVAAAAEVDMENVTDDDLEALESIRAALTQVRTEASGREEAAEDRRQRAEAAMAEIEGEPEVAETEPPAGDGEGDEVEGDEVEGEPPVEDDAPVGEVETPAPVAEAGAEVVPIAAGASLRVPATPSMGRLAARRPRRQAPRATEGERNRAVIRAGGDVMGFSAGQELTRDQLAQALVAKGDTLRRSNGGKLHVASVVGEHPERLRMTASAEQNDRILRAEVDSLAASGGVCAPFTPLYDVVNISDSSRPLVAGLPSVQSERGGFLWIPSPRLGNYTANQAKWTQANDANPTSPATKPCVRIDCDAPQTATLDAFPNCVEVGNFFAMTYDERVQAIIDLVGAEHARNQERNLLSIIAAGSTNISTGQHLGATRDILAGLILLLEGHENRWRTSENIRMRVALPKWVRGLMQVDLIRELPGAMAERLATSSAQIDSFLAAAGFSDPIWLADGEAGQDFALQGSGAILPWPGVAGGDATEVVAYVWAEGAWTHASMDRIDLGVVRDSTLNATNDLQIWSEEFETVFFRGIESFRITFDVCPNGWTSAPVDIDPCAIGS